jgi:hypothetical protein
VVGIGFIENSNLNNILSDSILTLKVAENESQEEDEDRLTF